MCCQQQLFNSLDINYLEQSLLNSDSDNKNSENDYALTDTSVNNEMMIMKTWKVVKFRDFK